MAQISSEHFSRGIVVWATILALLSVSLVLFGSPIFRVLGFEYSALSALMLSVACGSLSASRAARGGSLWDSLVIGLLLWLVPVAMSLISLIFLENCAIWDGLEFYCSIALPTTILASIFGTSIGKLSRSPKMAQVLYATFWLLTFSVSLLPGYIFPQLFTYGWQYGYFPGLVWDEYIELGSAYRWHLAEWAVLAIAMLLVATRSAGSQWWLKLACVLVLYIGLLLTRSDNRVSSSHGAVREVLSSSIEVDNARVFFDGSSLTIEEQELLRADVQWNLHDIRTRLELTDGSTVTIYLYPDTETLYRFVGTRNASIAKPWLSVLHIAKENLASLKHELVHVLLKEWGSFPFYASWSTGLTEGVAMAIEPSYDGMHTLHEHSSAILKMGLAEGVQRVMSFTGFASGASTTAYVLAGSFSQYLLEQYSVEKFKQAYSTLDFSNAYGKTLEQLEAEWKRHIMPLTPKLTGYDSLRTLFYFKRTSIISQPCLRRIGKLTHEAGSASRARRYDEAEVLYRSIFSETGSLASLRGMVTAKLRRLDLDGARSLLLLNPMNDHPQRLSLFLTKGDLLDDSFYDTLLSTELSSGSMLTAFARKHLRAKGQYLQQLYTSNSPLAGIPIDMMDTTANGNYTFAFIDDYLVAQAYEEEGMLTHARHYYRKAIIGSTELVGAEDIRLLLMLRLMSIDPGALPGIEQPRKEAWRREYMELAGRREYLKLKASHVTPTLP